MAIIKPITQAFREIFPATTGKQLADMMKGFRDFTKSLIINKETAAQLKSTFKGVFAIFSIASSIIKGVVGYFFSLFQTVGSGAGGVLDLTSSIGDLLVKLDTWLKQGDKIGTFFSAFTEAKTAVLEPIYTFIGKLIGAFGLLFQGNPAGFFDAIKGSFSALVPLVGAFQDKFNRILGLLNTGAEHVKQFFGGAASGASQKFVAIIESIQSAISDIRSALSFDIDTSGLQKAAGATEALSGAGDRVATIWQAISDAFGKVSSMFGPVSSGLAELFGTIKDKIVEYVKNLDFQDAVALLNTAFFIAMYSMLRKFIGQLKDIAGDFQDLLGSIAGTFDQLTNALKAMQQNVQASIILKIGIALGVLALAVLVLSRIDPEALKKALIAMTVMFAQLMATLYAFTKMNFAGGMTKAAAALVLLAIATSILAGAVQKLSGLDWAGLAKGLIGVGGLLGALILFTKFAQANTGGIKQGAGLILLAIAIKLLASSVETLGKMDMATLAKGVGSLSAIMLAMAGVVKIINGSTGMIQAAIGLGILSAALWALSKTMGVYAAMDWGTLIHGLATMAGTLALIGGSMRLMPANMPTLAAGLLIVSGALVVLAGALKMMGGMSVEEMAKSLITLTVALGAIAISLNAMTAAIPGAQALIIASGALLVLAGVLKILGSMDIESLGIALLAIAGVLTVIGVAAALLTPVIPSLVALAAALNALGIAMLLAGAGFALFAGGFAVMAAVGTAGVAVLIAAFTGILNLIPLFMQQIALGLRAFAKVIADSGPVIVNALTTLLLSLLQAIDRVIPQALATMTKFILGLLQAIRRIAPQFITTIGVIVMSMVNKISSLVPQIAAAGLRMIIGFLKAVGDKVPEIVKHATNIITKFLDAIGKAVPKIVDAGFKMVKDILKGVTDSVNKNSEAMGKAGGDLAVAIIRGMVNGIGAGIGQITEAARNLASNALNAAKEFLGIHSPSREFYKLGVFVNQGFRDGIDGSKAQVQAAFNGLKKMLSDTMRSSKEDVDALEKKLYRLTHARKKDAKAIRETRADLAQANKEYRNSSAAYKELTKNWTDDKNRLGQLGAQYDVLSQKIKNAKSVLADAIKTRDDYAKSIKDQYDDLPAITGDTKVQDFANELRKRIADTKTFAAQLQKLRALGLNDTMYKELLAKGPEALPFINELLGTGKSGVTQINDLGKQLDSAAGSLGTSASKALYQAAVDSAAGLVKGLQIQQKNIEKQMDRIADAMVKAIKKKLGIKSPSREFMKVGKFSAEGVAVGLDQHVKMVKKSAESVGHEAINSLRKSISGLDTIISDQMATNPVISPVIDLTDVKKGATKLGKMFGDTHGISVSGSFSDAKSASDGYQANLESIAQGAAVIEHRTDVQLTQINNSPKALSPSEIYRQTNNQISVMKGALARK
jgi:hypothetical protein